MAVIQGQITAKLGPRTRQASSSKAAVNSNLVICQSYIDPANFVPPSDHPAIIDTLSHLSLVHYNSDRVLTDFKGWFFSLR